MSLLNQLSSLHGYRRTNACSRRSPEEPYPQSPPNLVQPFAPPPGGRPYGYGFPREGAHNPAGRPIAGAVRTKGIELKYRVTDLRPQGEDSFDVIIENGRSPEDAAQQALGLEVVRSGAKADLVACVYWERIGQEELSVLLYRKTQ